MSKVMKQWEEERYREREGKADLDKSLDQAIEDIAKYREEQARVKYRTDIVAQDPNFIWNCNTGKYEEIIVNPDVPHLPHPSTEEYVIQEALFIRKMIMYESPQYYTNLLHQINIKRGSGIPPYFL